MFNIGLRHAQGNVNRRVGRKEGRTHALFGQWLARRIVRHAHRAAGQGSVEVRDAGQPSAREEGEEEQQSAGHSGWSGACPKLWHDTLSRFGPEKNAPTNLVPGNLPDTICLQGFLASTRKGHKGLPPVASRHTGP